MYADIGGYSSLRNGDPCRLVNNYRRFEDDSSTMFTASSVLLLDGLIMKVCAMLLANAGNFTGRQTAKLRKA